MEFKHLVSCSNVTNPYDMIMVNFVIASNKIRSKSVVFQLAKENTEVRRHEKSIQTTKILQLTQTRITIKRFF